MKWIVDRLIERSTWLGALSILAALGVTLQPDLQAAIITAGVSIGGLILVLTKDSK